MAAAPYIERMAPASWPLFCRNCARVTADKAGIATASIRPATQRATPISINVMPESKLTRMPGRTRGRSGACGASTRVELAPPWTPQQQWAPKFSIRLLRASRGRAFAAVDGDVVAAALGLVGTVGVDVIAFAGADVGVVG